MTGNKMPKDARKRLVLEFLDETGLALPPRAIYHNMDRITWSQKSHRRYLSELEAEEMVKRLDEPSTYYRITEAGRKHLQSSG